MFGFKDIKEKEIFKYTTFAIAQGKGLQQCHLMLFGREVGEKTEGIIPFEFSLDNF